MLTADDRTRLQTLGLIPMARAECPGCLGSGLVDLDAFGNCKPWMVWVAEQRELHRKNEWAWETSTIALGWSTPAACPACRPEPASERVVNYDRSSPVVHVAPAGALPETGGLDPRGSSPGHLSPSLEGPTRLRSLEDVGLGRAPPRDRASR